MSTAEAGDAREPPGLGPPRTRRSAATRAMAAAAGAGEEEAGPLLYVLALPVEIPLPVAVARIDAGVPRKARTGRSRPRAKPAGWWAFRLVNFPPVKAAAAKKSSPEKERSPHRERLVSVCLGLGTPDLEEERPAKKARRCVQCGSAETPQWRSGPMGRSTLCNACGVRLRAAGALRETAAEQRPPPPATKPRKVNNPPPPSPESPGSDSDSPICARRAPPGDVYLVRKQPKRERRTPRKDSSPAAASRAIYLVKKKKPSKKPWRPRNTGQRCLHCGTTSTPQWREGPMGRHTLCNACGVRYRQGRLLPEYRPAASPTFVASEHASRHREVLQLHRQRQGDSKTQQRRKQQPNKLLPLVDDDDDDGILLADRCVDAAGSDEDDKNNVLLVRRERPVEKHRYPPTPPHRPVPQPVDDDPRVGGGSNGAVSGCGGGGGGGDQKDAQGALDSLLLDGPSAPLIVDGGDEFLVS